jgi:F-type H+-transporting ATPase subunit c
MEIEAAKMIGAGLAAIGLGGVGVGIGNVFATTIATIGRNPSIQARVGALMWIGFALVEAIGLYALLVAFIVLFG